MNERLAKAEALFHEALELPAEQREGFLQQACGEDAELLREVAALLRASGVADRWLKETECESPKEVLGAMIGRYKLLETLGEGGCGVVWLAEQREPVRRKVALKIIKLGMDTRSVVARFEAERQALALMDHPNIAKVFDAGTTDTGRPYFVMELVRGIPITKFCDENKLATRERLDLFMKVCQAVQHAHQKGIIHRDLKPSNILITLHDGVPVPKVIDFGIAKATQQELTDKTIHTLFQQFIGTPAYVSPEQAGMSGLDIDTRSDIYSLGVLLYELLTGLTPFDGKELLASGLDEMRRTIREKEPVRPSTRLGTLQAANQTEVATRRNVDPPRLIKLLRGDLDWIVMKCLDKDRTRRYETANGLATDLKRHLSNEPVVARPPSNVYRFQKLVRRNKVAFAAAAMVLGALVLGLGMATWSFMRERVARVEADSGRQEAEQARHREQLERQRAEESAARAHAATTRLEIEKAEQLFGADNSATALAHLARILRQQPTNRVVAERILSALGQRNVCLPVVAFRHDAPVTSAQFSHDGARVVTSSEDNTARVWDSRTGQALTSGLQHGDDVLHTCFSPDGRKVATASRDYTARVWDSHTGQALTGLLQHTGAVVFVEFSPDGRLLATASEDLTARVWDSVTGLPITEPLMHSNRVNMVRFSPDGNWLLSCSKDYFGRVWNARTGQLRSRPMWEGNGVRFGQFAADSRQVMIGGASGVASLWDSATGTRPKRFQHGRGIFSAALSPDESRLVTVGSFATARLWDTADAEIPTPKPLHDLRHGNSVTTTCFSRNGRLVATGSADHTARIWSVQTGQPLTEPLNHDASLLSVEFSSDGQRLLTVAEQNFALVWDIRSGQPLVQYFADLRRSQFAAFSWDGQWVFADADNYAHVWDRFTGQLILATSYNGYQLTAVKLSPRKEFLAVCRYSNPAEIWKLIPDGSGAGPLKIGRNVRKAAFNPNGGQVALAEAGPSRVQIFDPNFYNVQIFDPNTGKPLGPILPHAQTVHSLEFSADGERLLTAAGLKARIWKAHTGAVEAEMQHNDAIVQARFSLDGNWVITASEDKTAAIWDWRKPREALQVFHHAAEVKWAELSQDAKLAVTVSLNSARVWDVKSGRLVSPPLTHLSGVNSARFSSDARRVITSSDDSTARIWDVQSGHALSEPLRHAGYVNYAEFSPDGRWAVTASGQSKSPCIWEVPDATEAVPAWLPRLAEAVAGQRFNHEGVGESVSAEELLALRAVCAAGHGAGSHDLWAKWFFDSSATRTLSPRAQLTAPEYARRQIEADRRQIEADTRDSLEVAARLAEHHYYQSNYAAAEPLYREVLQGRRARLEEKAEPVLTGTASLARLLADWAWAERSNSVAADVTSAAPAPSERAREAERLLRDTLAIRLRGTNATHWRTDDVRSRLGFALVALAETDSTLSADARQAKLAEAETLLLQSNERLQRSRSVERKYKGDALERLVRLYQAWGKPDQGSEWQQKLKTFGNIGEKPSVSVAEEEQ